MRALSSMLRHTLTDLSWLGEIAHAVFGFPLLNPWSLRCVSQEVMSAVVQMCRCQRAEEHVALNV